MSQTNTASPSLPNAKDLDVLRVRFCATDLSHPGIASLFNYVLQKLPAEGQKAHHHNSKVTPPSEIIPLDPINIVQMEVRLPPLPAVLGELQEVTNKPYASASDVGAVVGKDPSLTAWLLKLVNSPFFGFSNKVDTVTRGIALLGIEQFKTMAMSSMIHSLSNQVPPNIIDLDAFWRHSVGTGLAAQAIWKMLGRDEPERLFVSGLLHDCGILALAYAAPKTFVALEQAVRSAGAKHRHQVEQELLSFDHARLGGMLLHRWNMPLSLVMSVLRHHQVESPDRYTEAAVVHLADVVSRAVAGDTDQDIVPPLEPEVWKFLGLKGANLVFVADAMLERLNELCDMLRG
ncbi:MAG: HDOD domain-containing protein [Deltaproteobacteria bacterium]|jgi:HD-like signal output (HDOD) protein|nr:HDOD domain-containing protein [Deltaproteobacteria bacterium]